MFQLTDGCFGDASRVVCRTGKITQDDGRGTPKADEAQHYGGQRRLSFLAIGHWSSEAGLPRTQAAIVVPPPYRTSLNGIEAGIVQTRLQLP